MLKSSTVAADALYNVREDSGASDDYSRGIVVGVIAGIMAATGKTYKEVFPTVVGLLPDGILYSRLPDTFQATLLRKR